MRIFFVLENTMDNLEGGTEVSSRHLAGLLLRRGVGVEEWAPFNRRKPIFWYTSIFGQIYILIVLAWKLVKNRVQILHVQGKYLIPPVIILGKLLKIPTVVTVRDYVILCPIGLCLFEKGVSSPWRRDSLICTSHGFIFFIFHEIPKFLSIYHQNDGLIIRIIKYIFLIRGWLATWWLRFWLKRADAVISVSKYVQTILNTCGIKSRAIYNVFDVNVVPAPETIDSVIPAQAGIHKDNLYRFRLKAGMTQPTILFVGKFSYGKGHDLFLALSRNKLFKNYQFVSIGGKNKLPHLETLQKMREAAVVVVPSRWPEPFGRVALEALMTGTPVVAAARGGLVEIVEDGITGVLVEPEIEALVKGVKLALNKNAAFRKNILKRRRRLEEKFSINPIEKHLKLYTGLLK